MEGLAVLTRMGMTILDGFGLTSMFRAFIGGGLFLALVAVGVSIFRKK